jgi:hypothetical protein
MHLQSCLGDILEYRVNSASLKSKAGYSPPCLAGEPASGLEQLCELKSLPRVISSWFCSAPTVVVSSDFVPPTEFSGFGYHAGGMDCDPH